MIAGDNRQTVSYFKRFRMEADLTLPLPPLQSLSPEFTWEPWRDDLLEDHARVKQQSFNEQIDGVIFPNLSCLEGCLRLMRDIRSRSGFCPAATWLIRCDGVACGTIQGISDRCGTGVIQNLGVTPALRGRGLGGALLVQALHGFRSAGLAKAALEVTAQNESAIRLYWRLGFRRRRTLYKAVEVLAALPPAPAVDVDWWL